MEKLEKAMGDAAHAERSDAGNEGGLATTLDELIEQEAGPGVSEQAESQAEKDPDDAEAEEADEKGSENEESDEEDSLSDEEKAQLKKTTTERIERRIGKAHAKRKEAEEKAEAAQLERDELAARVADLQSSLEAVDVNAAAASSGVSDLFLVENEAALDKRADELSAGVDVLLDWLDEHERDDTMVLKDGTEYTYAEVNARKRELTRTIERDIPKARKVLSGRVESNAQAHKLYPNLFKATSPEYQEMQELLRTVPGLRARPDARLLIGRLLAGKAIEGKSSAPGKTSKKAIPTAPKPPDTSTPASKKAGRELQKHDPRKVAETGDWDDLL